MIVRFNRWYNAVLSALLSMLGFEACDIKNEYGAPPSEYGTPYASYEVKGQVTDEDDNPIPGIRITASNSPSDSLAYQTVIADDAGHYALKERELYISDNDMIEFEDVDGEANGGLFQTQTLHIREMPMEKTADGKSNWDDGTYKVNGSVKLKKQQK